MKSITKHPKILQQKVFLTFITGVACCMFGVGYYLFAHDRIFLIMSVLLMIACFAKGLEYYFIIIKDKYEVITGTCCGITASPLRKLRTVKVIDDDGNETSLKLNKNDKLKIGQRYRFYFRECKDMHTGFVYLDTRMAADCFLGYEIDAVKSEQSSKSTK